jgi:hypothetical protein
MNEMVVSRKECVIAPQRNEQQEKLAEKDLFFPEILRPYFSEEMIQKISLRYMDKAAAILLKDALKLAVEVVEEENRTTRPVF